MKKLLMSIIAVAILLSLASCELLWGGSGTTTTDKDHIPPELPEYAKSIMGLNESIFVLLDDSFNYDYELYYKKAEDQEYTKLDENLMISGEDGIECYILGISAGNYSVKINAVNCGLFEMNDIIVSAQDRSGYAHFGATEGVGAYNNDGTLKEGTKIVYITNENKNTVTCEIEGTVYKGLVKILQAQYKSSTPLLIRVIGKITTNQWNYKNVEPRLVGSELTGEFFENTFSTEYGENLANLIVKMNDKGAGYTYKYKTTPNGVELESHRGGGTGTTTYKGSDFPSLKGEEVYDDDSYYNMLEVSGARNITIEGVGSDAEFFQFGIGFEKCNNIEIKNLTFTAYPEDALNFLGGDRADLANYSRYWIHNCTFNRGYNAWDISGERDKYAGDGSIDFNNVSYTTIAYNKFDNCKKTMLFGSGDSEACMNMTMHHNHFYKVDSRLPLGRNVNVHSYNNYFDQCKNCSDIRKNSYLFSENNYFNATSSPFKPSSSAVKSFGDIFVDSNSSEATVVTDREKAISSSCKPDKTNNLENFDTNSTLFYYDSVNKRSDVSIMTDAGDVPAFVEKHAGAGKNIFLELTK